jgi:hypothetical protein
MADLFVGLAEFYEMARLLFGRVVFAQGEKDRFMDRLANPDVTRPPYRLVLADVAGTTVEATFRVEGGIILLASREEVDATFSRYLSRRAQNASWSAA